MKENELCFDFEYFSLGYNHGSKSKSYSEAHFGKDKYPEEKRKLRKEN